MYPCFRGCRFGVERQTDAVRHQDFAGRSDDRKHGRGFQNKRRVGVVGTERNIPRVKVQDAVQVIEVSYRLNVFLPLLQEQRTDTQSDRQNAILTQHTVQIAQ